MGGLVIPLREGRFGHLRPMLLLLLAGAGLLLRTLIALQDEDPGGVRQGIATARISLPEAV